MRRDLFEIEKKRKSISWQQHKITESFFLLRRALIWGEWENKPIKVNIVADAAFSAHSLIVEIIQEDGKLEKIVWSDWLLSSKNDLESYPSWFWEEDKCISCPTLEWLD